MAEISMDLVGHLFGGAAAGKFVATVISEGGTTGIMETVTQQLGLGLMLSTLLITVPPMAGMWFNGIMASYSGYNAMQGWGNGQPATPPGMNSQSQVEQRANQVSEKMIQNSNHSTNFTPYTMAEYGNSLQPTNTNIIKTQEQTQIGLANRKTTKEGDS